jgi:phospholipid/cholesterol/gamma-HCH transport system ATP-binding protein
MIELHDVHLSFGEKRVLNGLSLRIEDGETFCVIGRNGIGKTVTLKLVLGLIKPDQGRVIIGDEDITRLGESDLIRIRDKFGVVFQGSALLNWMTIADNVALPLRERTKMSKKDIQRVVTEKLELMGMGHAAGLYPAECSGGMKKRAAVARAIVRDPQIILYDEPTAGLDPIMANTVDRLIMELRQKMHITSVVVTHHMASAYHVADRMGMLSGGKIIQVGTPEEIRTSENPIVRQFVEGRVSASPAEESA